MAAVVGEKSQQAEVAKAMERLEDIEPTVGSLLLDGVQIDYSPTDNFLITAFLLESSSETPSSFGSISDDSLEDKEVPCKEIGELVIDEGKGNVEEKDAGPQGPAKDGPIAAEEKAERPPEAEFSILRHLLENGKRQQTERMAKPCMEYFRKLKMSPRFGSWGNGNTGCPFSGQVRGFCMSQNTGMNLYANYERERLRYAAMMHPYMRMPAAYTNRRGAGDFAETKEASSSAGSSEDDFFEEEEVLAAEAEHKKATDLQAAGFSGALQSEPLNLSSH